MSSVIGVLLVHGLAHARHSGMHIHSFDSYRWSLTAAHAISALMSAQAPFAEDHLYIIRVCVVNLKEVHHSFQKYSMWSVYSYVTLLGNNPLGVLGDHNCSSIDFGTPQARQHAC